MITKVTASNAELYYAPRFAEITRAFAEIGSPIEIKSLEDYFLHLTDIANLQVGAKNIRNAYLLVAPADEDIFTINANTREISVPAFVKKNGIGVYGDHRAEMIVMTIDRYFDHEDFLQDKIAINWNFTPSGARAPLFEDSQAVEAFAPNEELNPGLITFGFIITKDMTPMNGTLTFSVTIYDDRSGEIVYSFNTLPAMVSIKDTLTLTDPAIVKSDVDNYVGRLTNSIYIDTTVSSIDDPEWLSGVELTQADSISGLAAGSMSGLDRAAYLPASEDLANNYPENGGTLLQARAITSPNTADMTYKWTYSPINGTVDMGRDYNTTNRPSDYLAVIELPAIANDDGSIYYTKDALGRVDTTNPMTLEQAIEAKAENEDLEFVVRGTSFVAHAAGNYQVFAQARIGAGENYVEVRDGARLEAGVNYFKKVDGEIDTANPLVDSAALTAQANGEQLYKLIAAARNSNEVASVVLEVPAAKKPNVVLGVQSSVEFGENLVLVEDSEDDTVYTYIDSNSIPVITATVTIEGNNEDKAGAFAVELVDANAIDHSKESIETKIESGDLTFSALPVDGIFTIQPATITEGSYTVRAINRRNGTYSVSDKSDSITTSFVAPAINHLTVEAIMGEGEDNTIMLLNGAQPNDELQTVEYNNNITSYDFIISNDGQADNVNGAVTSYFVEEVDAEGNSIENDRYQGPDNWDIKEIIADANGILKFTINDDIGYYRIKTINTYHKTQRTAYTSIFRVTGS